MACCCVGVLLSLKRMQVNSALLHYTVLYTRLYMHHMWCSISVTINSTALVCSSACTITLHAAVYSYKRCSTVCSLHDSIRMRYWQCTIYCLLFAVLCCAVQVLRSWELSWTWYTGIEKDLKYVLVLLLSSSSCRMSCYACTAVICHFNRYTCSRGVDCLSHTVLCNLYLLMLSIHIVW